MMTQGIGTIDFSLGGVMMQVVGEVEVEAGIAAKIPKKLASKASKILHLSLREKVELLNSYNKIIVSVLCGELKASPTQ
tara:strand:+ start:545 stop:781 length:237 start_codon:yes stop_codon:yes gene_type:complete